MGLRSVTKVTVALGFVCSPGMCQDSMSGSMSVRNPGPILETGRMMLSEDRSRKAQ